MSTIFISHSSKDKEAYLALRDELIARRHHDLFLDVDPEKGIKAGVSWELTLYTQLRACDAVVALCSHNYLASHWCFAELALARMEGKEIFALQIDPWHETGPSKTVMPSILTEGQYLDMRTDPKGGYERLWRGFEAKSIVPAEFAEWKPEEPPYPGLRAFEQKDSPIFFGREKEVQAGVELLNTARRQGHPRLIMALGASGSGKSSLARAGIVPRLGRDRDQWLVVGPFRPGSRPAQQLAFALSEAFGRAGRELPSEALLGRLESAGTDVSAPGALEAESESARERLLEALRAFQAELTDQDLEAARSLQQLKAVLGEKPSQPDASGPGHERRITGNPLTDLALELQHGSEVSVVVVIDQFEELLGHRDPAHPANSFLRMLREGMAIDGTPLLVLGTMRSDFLEPFQTSPELLGLGFKKLSVGPMSREGMRQVIEKPARLGGLKLDEGLTDLLLDDTGTSDALPLLAFTLRVMWERRADKHRLAKRDYEDLGRLEGAIGKVADETLEAALERGQGSMESKERELRDAFLRMARPSGEGSGWARQPADWEKLPETVQPMIQHFVDQRLLTRKDKTIEVAHEALFRSWEKLRRWLAEDAERLHLRTEIALDAAKWKRANPEEKDSYLWRKGRLLRAIELRDDNRLILDEDELAFLGTAETAENRARLRRRRRLKTLVAAASLAAAVMAVLAILAWFGQKKAERQRRNALIQVAKALSIQSRTAGFPLDQSLLASVEAGRLLERVDAPGELYEARTALLELLLTYPTLDSFLHGHEDRIWTIAVSPDGLHLASGSSDGRLLLWNLKERRALWNLDHCKGEALPPDEPPGDCGERVKRVKFSPDGSKLASSGDKAHRILVWSIPAGELEVELPDDTSVEALAMAPDNRSLASGDGKGRVRLWQLADRSHVELTADPQGRWVSRVAFTSDGRRLLSAGSDKALRVWEVSNGSPGEVLCQNEGDKVIYALRVSSRGLVAMGFNDGSVLTWNENERPPADCSTGAIQAHQSKEIRDLAFSPDGRTLATAGFDGVVWLWDAATLTRQMKLEGHGRGAWTVDIGPDGTVATGAGDGAVRLWDPSRERPRQVVTDHPDSRLLRVAFGGQKRAATGANTGSVRVNSLPDLLPSPGPSRQDDEITGVAISPDLAYLGVSVGKKAVQVWELGGGDAASGRDLAGPLLQHDLHKAWIWRVAFGPSSRLLASSDDRGFVWLWRFPEDRRQLLVGAGAGVMSLAFDPLEERSTLAIGRRDGSVEIWDTETQKPLREPLLGHTKQVAALAFSPDGLRLASTGLDQSVRVWNLERETEPLILNGHEAAGRSLAFAPDGRRLASGDVEGVIRVWDVETGLPLYGLLGDQDMVLELAFEQEGWLVSGHSDKTLRRWEIGLVEPLESAYVNACRLANRNLNATEWSKLFGNEERRKSCPDLP